MSERREALLPLTSLRFFAALIVMTWHCAQTRALAATFSLGYAGVAFFFLLSGFILTYTYHDAFRCGLRWEAVRAFYAARFARVYPLHLVTIPIAVACMAAFGGHGLWDAAGAQTRLQTLAAQAALVQSWIPLQTFYFGGNGPSWSISVEAFFYALFPLLAYGLLRVFGRAPRAALWAAGGLWLAESLVLWPQHADVADWRWYVFPPSRLVDFVVGMLLGFAFVGARAPARWKLRPTSVEIIALAAVFLSICASPFVPVSMRFAAWFMPASSALIFVFAHRRGALSRLLSHPLAVRLGEVSFAFYLCHLPVIDFARAMFGEEHPLFIPLAVGIALVSSFALYHGIEQPMRARIRRLLADRPARTAASEGALVTAS
jgi:peptidoglycan/LPS O-acetylase OafA/YrhL